jgi:Fur family transcriptional regulator, ferric uptake regulator
MKKGESVTERTKTLRDAGLRKTGPRLAVLGVLERAKSPLSHADVADALVDDGFDRATVYRNLIALTEVGLVRRNDLGDHVWRFELVRADAPNHESVHPHFVCTDCGTVSCLPDVTVRIDASRASAVAKKATEVQLRGVCTDCEAPRLPRSRAR